MTVLRTHHTWTLYVLSILIIILWNKIVIIIITVRYNNKLLRVRLFALRDTFYCCIQPWQTYHNYETGVFVHVIIVDVYFRRNNYLILFRFIATFWIVCLFSLQYFKSLTWSIVVFKLILQLHRFLKCCFYGKNQFKNLWLLLKL